MQHEGVPTAAELGFARRALIATTVVITVVLVVLLLLYAADLLLLLFAAVLTSIPLRRLGGLVQRATGLGHGVSLALVTVGLFGVAGAIGWLTAGRVVAQSSELTGQLRVALQNLTARLEGHAWAQEAIARLPTAHEVVFGRGGLLLRLPGLASTALGAIVNVAIVIIIAIYLASQPHLYAGGIKHLLPFGYRRRAGEVFAALDEALGRWLVGRIGLMLINGASTAVALSLLGVPLAVTLGIIAGVLNFIPNFGPFIAAVPAVLIAFVGGFQLALYTAFAYLVIQMVDAYVLTPLVDRKSVELPPVLTISAQLLLGVIFGFVGLLVASPLTATAMILVRMLYIEDVLGDRVTTEGRTR
jgi:predicted PurR-regulated permease PerM